jgi:hypothetical protein
MSSAILVRDDANLKITFSKEAEALKESAMTCAALIGRVTNPLENQRAVDAQTALKTIISTVEKARTEVKAPVLEYGRAIDAAARSFVAGLESEMLRVSKLAGNFAALEQAKVRAADAARRLEEEKIEKERMAEQQRIVEAERAEQQRLSEESTTAAARLQVAKNEQEAVAVRAEQVEIDRQKSLASANSHEALDAVNEHFSRQAANLPIVAAVRSDGQIITSDWAIEVTDAWKLARCHPTCVNITPRISEIKDLLKMGIEVKGIRATPVVKAGVRAGSQRKAVEV